MLQPYCLALLLRTSTAAYMCVELLVWLSPCNTACADVAPACARCDSNGGQQLVNTSYYHAALSVPVPSWQLNTSWGANGLLTRFDNVMQALWVLMQVRAGDTSAGRGY